MREKRKNQGDVVFLKIDKLPEGLRLMKGATVAFGEHTGHNHTFYDDELAVAEKFDHRTDKGSKNVILYQSESGTVYADVKAPVYLKHQEHKPIKYEPGIYKTGIVRQYDYEKEESQRVVD